MQLHFTARNIELTPGLKESATEKFQRLEKFKNIDDINIVFRIENVTQIVEATLEMAGTRIHATAESSDMYDAIDNAVDKLQTQIKKQKDKQKDHHRA